jgi:hypothetical protein
VKREWLARWERIQRAWFCPEATKVLNQAAENTFINTKVITIEIISIHWRQSLSAVCAKKRPIQWALDDRGDNERFNYRTAFSSQLLPCATRKWTNLFRTVSGMFRLDSDGKEERY